MLRILFVCMLLIMPLTLSAHAATKANPQTLIGSFGGWRAYTFKENRATRFAI